MKRIQELDGLRAIAILLVLGCHYRGFAGLLGGLPEFGWVGVELFFVLSGYLITTILLGLRDQAGAYRTFYSRRMIRILPPYFAVTGLAFLFGVVSHHHWATSSQFILKQLLFLQGYFPEFGVFFGSLVTHAPHFPNLLHLAHELPIGRVGLITTPQAAFDTYWSLSIEEYFYLLWAPIVLKGSMRTIVLSGIAVCVVEALLRWSFASAQAYYGLFFRFDALMYGAFLALFLQSARVKLSVRRDAVFFATISAAVVALGSILALISPVLGREIRESPLMLAFGLPLISIASAGVIGLFVLRARSPWWPARLMRTAPMQYIGTISYTMYLLHVLAAVIVFDILRKVVDPDRSAAQLTAAILSSILTIVLARISWLYLERPLLRWKDRRFPASKSVEQPAFTPEPVQLTYASQQQSTTGQAEGF